MTPEHRARAILAKASKKLRTSWCQGSVSEYNGVFRAVFPFFRPPSPGEWWATHHSIVGALFWAGGDDAEALLLAAAACYLAVLESDAVPTWKPHRDTGYPRWLDAKFGPLQDFNDARGTDLGAVRAVVERARVLLTVGAATGM